MLFQFGLGGAVMPFVTLYLLDRGLNITGISQIFFGASGMLLFFPFFWGMMADRYIPLNRLFTILNILLILILGIFTRQFSFTGLMISYMCFYACFNPSLLLLNPLSFHHLKNPRADFGRLRLWGSIGWMIPSAIIFYFLATNPKLDLVYTVYLGMGIGVLMLGTSFFLPHTPSGTAHIVSDPETETGLTYFQAVRKLMTNKAYLIVLVVFFLVASSFSIQAIYSPLMLEQMGLERKWIGPAQCIGVVLEVFLFIWQRRFLHRLSYAGTILVGAVAMLLRHFIFAFSDSLTLMIVSHLLTGLVIVFHHIGASVLVNAIAPKEVRSTAQTLLVLFGSGLGPMTANLSVGFISEATNQNLRMVFLFAACLACLGTTILALSAGRLNRAARQ